MGKIFVLLLTITFNDGSVLKDESVKSYQEHECKTIARAVAKDIEAFMQQEEAIASYVLSCVPVEIRGTSL